MSFLQAPPQLVNPFHSDRVLQSSLRRVLSHTEFDALREVGMELGQLIADELYPQQLAERRIEPVHTPFDAWGQRIDHISLTPLWQRFPDIATRFGLVWRGYDQALGPHSRLMQFALVYLVSAASDFYACPLAMTDGAARALIESGNEALIRRAVAHLTARRADQMWTSGQWMTETTGGSDISRTETRAVRDGELWRIYGRKWFTSAATSEVALLLARPDGNPEGSEGLALFYIEPRDAAGRLQHIRVDRLKDKLGTRKLPTAELTLEGAPAHLVGSERHGVRLIAPVLNQTRVWNTFAALSYFRKGLMLLRDYGRRRSIAGKSLADLPLHQDTVAGLQAEFEAGLHLALHLAELMGKQEHGLLDDRHRILLRLLIPIAKLLTAKQALSGLSEIVEGFGGAGYVEDSGIPGLLRDAQVFSIWEGATDVLALDALKVLQAEGSWAALQAALFTLAAQASGQFDQELPALCAAFDAARQSLTSRANAGERDARARGVAMTLGRCYAFALLARHASWASIAEQDPRPIAAARRFVAHGLNRCYDSLSKDARRLALDELD